MNTADVRRIRIDALDTLFFRDGKPFTMGAETWADVLFPPSPSVLYGALRNQYFGEHVDKLPLANTSQDPTRHLTITLVALQHQEGLLFPLPYDYVTNKNSSTQQGLLLQIFAAPMVSNCPLPRVLVAEAEQIVETVEQGFLTDSALTRYLHRAVKTVHYAKLNDYTVAEPKLGIKRQRLTHTTEQGMLYRIDMRRLAPVREFGREIQEISLCVEFSGLPIAERGVFRLGGEGKMAAYQPSAAEGIAAPQLEDKRFKLYLATPALFSQGWLPGWIDPATLQATGQYARLGIRLESAILGKPVRIGGFNMKTKHQPASPKVMRQAVPAGSIYYFTLEGDIQEAIAVFHNQRISDYDSQQGFGLAFVGGVQ